MKKLIAFLTAVLIFISCFMLCVSADSAYTFSEDGKTVYAEGYIYESFNIVNLNRYPSDKEYEVKLTEKQKKDFTWVTLMGSEDNSVMEACFGYHDGAELRRTYLRKDLIAEYKSVKDGNTDTYYIECGIFGENTVEAKTERLKMGAKITILHDDYIANYGSQTVFAELGEEKLHLDVGAILCNNEEYYYLDYFDAGINFGNEWPDEFEVYMVEDPDILSRLAEANDVESVDAAWNNFSDFSTAGLLTVLLLIIPGIVFIFAFIMTFVSKKATYKKNYILAALLSAAEILIFAIIVTLVIISNFF